MPLVDWEAWHQVGRTIDASSGALFIVLGVFVGLMRPRTRLSTWFAVFAIGFGAFYLLTNVAGLPGTISRLDRTLYAAGLAMNAAAILALVMLADHFPAGVTPSRSARWGRLGLVMVSGLATALYFVGRWPDVQAAATPLGVEYPAGVFVVSRVGQTAENIAAAAFLAMLAFRFPRVNAASIPAVLAVAISLGLFQTWQAGYHVMQFRHESSLTWDNNVSALALVVGAAGAWGWTALRASTNRRKKAWRVTWALLAGALGGMVFTAFIPPPGQANNLGVHGVLRTAGVVILAYSILKHQLFDIDLKLKLGIKQSTIVAIVLAVFIGVQTFVSEYFTSTAGLWAGALAMAGMVLAFRPLQTLGQKVADRAMPNVRPLSERSDDERADLYAQLAMDAWADGQVGRKERALLDNAAARLGLADDVVMRLERDAARA